MKEVLLNIGSIVEVTDKDGELNEYMIIGRRVINPTSMKAWDYIAVWYPTGLVRTFKTNGEFLGDDYFYFNHPDIEKISYANELRAEYTEDVQKDDGGEEEC